MRKLSPLLAIALLLAAGCGDDSSSSSAPPGEATFASRYSSEQEKKTYVQNQLDIAEAASKGVHAAEGVMPLTKSTILEHVNQRLALIESQADTISTLAKAAGDPWPQKADELKTLIEDVKTKREAVQPVDPTDLAALKPVAMALDDSLQKVSKAYAELRTKFGPQLTDMSIGGQGGTRTESGPPGGARGPRGPRGPGGQ